MSEELSSEEEQEIPTQITKQIEFNISPDVIPVENNDSEQEEVDVMGSTESINIMIN